MHHNNFGNFYTREIYAVPIPIGFIPIPIPIPIMSRMAIPIPMGFPWEWGFPLPCTPLLCSVLLMKHMQGCQPHSLDAYKLQVALDRLEPDELVTSGATPTRELRHV